MEEHIHRRSRIAVLVATVAIVAAACSSSSGSPAASTGASAPAASSGGRTAPGGSAGASLSNIGGEVSVLGDVDRRRAGLVPGHGQAVDRRRPASRSTTPGQRDLATQLTTGIAGGNLPDVAGLPGPGQMQQWHDRARSSRSTSWTSRLRGVDAGRLRRPRRLVDGKMVGIFTKATVKGLIWYNTKIYTAGAPADWDALKADRAAARRRRGPGASAGSPAATPAGPAPTGSRTSCSASPAPTSTTPGSAGEPEVDLARDQGRVRGVRQGPRQHVTAARSTSYAPTSAPPATRCSPTRPAACSTTRRASSPPSSRTRAAQPTATSTSSSCRTSTRRTPARSPAAATCSACSTTRPRPRADPVPDHAEAQEIWAKRGGGHLAPTSTSRPSVYPDDASRKSAETFVNAQTFRFDAVDLMPNAMNEAFFRRWSSSPRTRRPGLDPRKP